MVEAGAGRGDGPQAEAAGPAAADPLRVHPVPLEAPWLWLAAGWRDLWAAPGVGLTYGIAFALGAGGLALWLWHFEAHALFPAFAGGFLLIAPFLAMGLYEASRRLSEGKPATLGDAIVAGANAKGQIAFFGIALMILFLAWLELAFMLLMLFLGGRGLPAPSDLLPALLFTWPGLGLLIVGTAVGGALAALAFTMSAIAVPILLDERVDAVTAMRASFAGVMRSPQPMALWAALIAFMIGAGFATLLAGFVIAFPLIGHATWHAYRHVRDGVVPPAG
jgi:uncharacterized membrane protein